MKQTTVSWKSSGDRNLGSLLETSRRSLARTLGVVACGAVLLMAGASRLQAQTLAPNWYQQSPATSPPPRYIDALTYDAGHGQAVLFGGFGESGYLNDTWLWNGSNWSQASPANSPSPRAAELMAYDAAQGQVVLFGGLATVSSRLGDTWLWNGSNWTQASPANSPPARASGVMVYDAATSQIVLFGGVNAGGSDIGDTWLWNGTDWTQATPANSPSPRDDYAMVYDAAHGEVVLFGGASNGTYLNDTWVWNGTNWTQLSPANSPPARYTPGMAYDAALGQVVMWGGYNGTYLNDTWVWDGTNWTQETPQNSPTGRYASNAITYDAAQGQVLLFGGLDSSQEFNDTWVWGLPGNFGNVNVCPSGQTTPAPCSETLALTFNVPGKNFGATTVLTQGTTGLDFSLASGNTCTGAVSPGTCTVNVTFTPLAPGLRTGAVELFNNSGALLTITPIYGVGQGPAVAFSPGTQTTVNTGSYSLSTPKGVTVDAAGNLFISNANGGPVVKVPAGGGTPTTLGVGLEFPQGMAVDGAGDLFIADNNLNEVLEVPAGCTSSICQQVVATGDGLSSQLGVAIDGAGNLFVGDYNDQEVVEFPASEASPAAVYNPGGNSHPVGLAVDGAGDLFVADYGLAKVVEVPAGCPSSGCQITVGSGWSQPESVAVDAAGDVFVADIGLGSPGAVVEVPAGCTSSSCQIAVASGIQSYGATVDAAGDLFIADDANNRVVEVDRAQAPSLSFAATNVGSTSSDSPQSVTIQNIGNQTLGAVPPGLVVNGPNFVEAGGQCSATFALTPGEECNLSISFDPQVPGNPLASTAVFTDNALNAAPATQVIALSGVGVAAQPTTVAVPNVVGQTQSAATTSITGAQLALGTVTTAFSSTEPSGSVISQNPSAGTQATLGSLVSLVVSTGQPPAPNQLSLENNYFVTGDYAAAGVTLRGTGVSGIATGTITIPSGTGSQMVPTGADIIDAFLYWETVENTPSPSSTNGTFLGYPITGQQIGSDQPYTDGSLSGTLRVYRADVNAYLPGNSTSGIRYGSGSFTVSLPDAGGSALPLTEGASMVVIYRALVAPGSTNPPSLPLKSVVIYDGSAIPTTAGGALQQTVQGFYDAVGSANSPGEVTNLYAGGGSWNNSTSSVTLPKDANQYSAMLNPGGAYAAVIFSTPVANSDNDGILDAWKTPGNPGYYDAKTGSWVPLPGAAKGQKDLFVQLDYMCSAFLSDGITCDFTKENLYPSPDANGNDPLAMVQQAFAAPPPLGPGITLHLEIGNAILEDTCTDNGSQLCEFPNQPGVVDWKNSLEIAKVWPRNPSSCASGGDCTARFPYGQKDSYHYVLFGYSLAIPAWNTRYGTLTSISANSSTGQTTIVTANRGAQGTINYCPSRFTISGVLGSPSLNGVYNTAPCPDAQTIILTTPGVTTWTYPNNTLPEPVIGLTSGTVTSISGYSDLGGADSAVTLGLWETAPNQDMSKRANVIAGTLYHEIGHTLGLSHGGLYYSPGSYIPTFDVNCKPNYQSSMNYLFQLDGVGPNAAVAYSNQTLNTLTESMLSSETQLTDTDAGFVGKPATFTTSSWYTPNAPSSTASAATLHCDGTPLNGDTGYRVNGTVDPVSPLWSSNQNITFDGVVPTSGMLGYNDVANIDLRQVGATGGEFASLASLLSFGSSSAPINIAAGGNVTLGSGGTVTLGSGGTVTLGSGGNVTLGSGGTIALGSGGNITLGSGGTVTLGSGGTITLGSGGTPTAVGPGTYTFSAGGTIALGSGGNVTLGSGGNVTLGSGGTITLGSGGNITLGSGGNVTLGSGGSASLGGDLSAGSGGNVTLGSGGTIALGSGGTVTLGSGGNVTLGSGGNVTLGSGGTIALGSGGNVTLGSGGTVTLGSGGTITLGSGGTPTAVGPGTYTLGAGGTVTLGSGGNVTLGSGGTIALGSGGTITLGSGGTVTLGSGGTVTLGSGGVVALGSGGTVALGSGGTVALGSGGTIALGSGGNVTLGSGGESTAELTYDTANSFVRPPSSPGYTPSSPGVTPAYVTINWSAPAFGVVQAYTIYRQSTYGTTVDPPVVIGSVTGNPPATTFVDTNPDTAATTVVYTISTSLVPDTNGAASRQSVPSPPAVLKYNQTIVLNPLSAPPVVGTPVSVTATSQTNGAANSLSVGFSASSPTGSCSIGSQSPTSQGSTANLTLTSVGSCTITASQTGSSTYNAANPVSETFQVVSSAGNAQQIVWAPLSSVQYGSTFPLTATSTAGLPVSFATSGPCTTSGTTIGIGLCTVTATAQGNSMYGTASAVQSFNISPAIITVTANSPTIAFGQTPVLTFTLSGHSSFATGTPALSTTANASSAPGTYPITIAAGTMTVPTGYSLVFVPGTLTVDQPPSITSANTTTFTVGTASTFTATASGYPASMTFGKTGALPNGVTLSTAGVLSGTPAAGTGGTYPITITASNGVSPAGTQNFTLVVDQPPSITSANTTTFTVGTAGTFTVTANGYPASTYSKTGTLPNGIALSAAGVLSGTPAAGTGGSYPITITATNGVGSATMQSFTLLVDQAPVITSAHTTTFTVGASGTTFPVTASGYPAPTFTETGTLPSGVTLSTAGVFSGTPAAGTGGSYPITITATNGITPAGTQSFTLIVNQALAITSPNNATFKTGTSGTFDVTGTGYPTSTYTETGKLPAGVTLTSAGVLSGTPAAGTGGVYAITIIDSDGVLSNVTQSFTLTVDQAPTITSANSTTFAAGTAGSFTVTASGYPASMSYSYSGTLPTGVTLSTVGVLAGTPTAGTGGSYPITIAASNGITPAGTQSFTLKVDQAPAITSVNNATFTVGASGTFSVTTTGYPTASTITESGPLPSGVTFVNNANGTGTLSGKATVSGIYPITFTAANGVGTAATQSFTLTSETTVPASGTTCNGVYTGTFSGNITVSTGQNCIFVKGGVTGNITETGGNIVLSGATVGGNLIISGGTFSVGPSATIKGNLTVQSIPTGTAQNQICGTSVGGSLVLQSVGTAAVIGSGTTACPGNTIGGSLTLQANKAAIGLTGNTVDGSLTDQSNTASTTLSGNTVDGSLTDQGNTGASVVTLNLIKGSLIDQSNSASSVLTQNTVGANLTDQGNTAPTQVTSNKVTGILLCQSNSSITGSGNTASKKQGQCANF